jgi:hypothetical protein
MQAIALRETAAFTLSGPASSAPFGYICLAVLVVAVVVCCRGLKNT